MTRKYFVVYLLLLALGLFLFSACSPAAADMIPTPTPDTSIVWEDDFEDGIIDGWEEDTLRTYFVNQGVLTSGPKYPDPLFHESSVSVGTWSFDLNFDSGSYYSLCLSCERDFKNGYGIYVVTRDDTSISISTLSDYTLSPVAGTDLGIRLTGWNHFDVTRDDSGCSKIFLNGELVLEYKDNLSISPHFFVFDVEEVGLEFDNLVVRNKVIDIQP